MQKFIPTLNLIIFQERSQITVLIHKTADVAFNLNDLLGMFSPPIIRFLIGAAHRNQQPVLRVDDSFGQQQREPPIQQFG
ncbi:hypothetical protein [Paenibacillus qinlingensis]|uniref:hypothetical protein n=1 Tax=Paenibacillus qinlingensis TaxID=1837343 RepID=UPI0015631282|nr:hypothetical protein [Paenibacillus qinlingensis]